MAPGFKRRVMIELSARTALVALAGQGRKVFGSNSMYEAAGTLGLDEKKNIVFRSNDLSQQDVIAPLGGVISGGGYSFVYDHNYFVQFNEKIRCGTQFLVVFLHKNPDFFYTNFYFAWFDALDKKLILFSSLNFKNQNFRTKRQQVSPFDRFVGVVSGHSESDVIFYFVLRNYQSQRLKILGYFQSYFEWEELLDSTDLVSGEAISVAIMENESFFPWSGPALIIQKLGESQDFFSFSQNTDGFSLKKEFSLFDGQLFNPTWKYSMEKAISGLEKNSLKKVEPADAFLSLMPHPSHENKNCALFLTADNRFCCLSLEKISGEIQFKVLGTSNFKISQNHWLFYGKMRCAFSSQVVFLCHDGDRFWVIHTEQNENGTEIVKNQVGYGDVQRDTVFSSFFEDIFSSSVGFRSRFSSEPIQKSHEIFSQKHAVFPFLLCHQRENGDEIGFYSIYKTGQFFEFRKHADEILFIPKSLEKTKNPKEPLLSKSTDNIPMMTWYEALKGFIENKTSFLKANGGVFFRCIKGQPLKSDEKIFLKTTYQVDYYVAKLLWQNNEFLRLSVSHVISEDDFVAIIRGVVAPSTACVAPEIEESYPKESAVIWEDLLTWSRRLALLNLKEVRFEINEKLSKCILDAAHGGTKPMKEYVKKWQEEKIQREFSHWMLRDSMMNKSPSDAAMEYLAYFERQDLMTVAVRTLTLVENDTGGSANPAMSIIQQQLSVMQTNLIRESEGVTGNFVNYRKQCLQFKEQIEQVWSQYLVFQEEVRRLFLH